MPDAQDALVLYLAFANEQEDRARYLRSLPDEVRQLQRALEPLAASGRWQVVVRTNATLDDLLDDLRKYRDRIALFHYGGHADSYQLLFESGTGGTAEIDAAGFAALLAEQNGLQLVFFNACSTQPQVERLLEAGTPAVIATSQDIVDEVATDFAVQFYRSLAAGASVRTAYNEAAGAVRARRSDVVRGDGVRNLRPVGPEQSASGKLPWDLYIRPGAEAVEQWDLPTAVNDPLFGLPDLPALDLPATPYRHLHWYRREDAEIFFGRGRDIRDLFQRVASPDGAPIILFYGQSGVGKSSLLAAGLLPRLEQSHRVLYARRDQTLGLTETLTRALGQPVERWREMEQAAGRPLVVVLDQVEELFTRPHADANDELPAFLDQVATVFADAARRPQGRLILSFRKEWLAEIEKQMVERGLPRGKVFLQRLDKGGIVEAILGPTHQQRLRDQYQLTIADGLADEIAADLLSDRGSSVAPTLQILLSKLWERARSHNYDRPVFDEDLYHELRSQGLLLSDFLNQQLAALTAGQADIVASGLALDLLAFHTTKLGTAEQRTLNQLRETYRHQEASLPSLLATFRDLYLLVDPAENQPDAESASRLAHDTLAPLVRAQFDESDAPGQRARRILESRSVEWQADAQAVADAAPLDKQDLAIVEKGEKGMRSWTEAEQRLIEASLHERARRERLQRILWVMAAGAVAIIAISSVFGWWQWGLAAERGVAEAAARSTAEAEANKAVMAEATAVAEATRAYNNEVSANRSAELAATRELEAVDARDDAQENARRSQASELIAGSQVLLAQEVSEPSLALLLAIEAANRTLAQDGYVAPFADWNLQQVVVEAERIGWRMTLPRHQHAEEVMAAVFSPDGATILTGSEDQTARLWDAVSGEQRTVFVGHDGPIFGADFSPDGTLVATTGEDGTLRFWNPESGEQLRSLDAAECRVRGLDFSPDGAKIVTASQDGAAAVWDVVSGERLFDLVHERKNCDNWVLSARFSPDGQWIATAGSDSTARIWDAQTGELKATLPHPKWVRRVAFSTDSSRLVTANAGGAVFVWDVVSGEQLGEFEAHVFPADTRSSDINDIAFSDDGAYAATVSVHGQALLRDAASGDVLKRLVGHQSNVISADFSPDSRRLLTAGTDDTARVWDVESGEELLTIGGHAGGLRAVAFSPTSELVATASDDATVRLWEMESGLELRTLKVHTDTVRAVAFSPDGLRLATASEDVTGRIWDVASGSPIQTLTGYTDTMMAIAFSPDGLQLVTAGEPARVDIWDAASGGPIRSLVGHTDTVRSAIFSPDGLKILTASDDGSARLWDAASGAELAQFRGHEDEVKDATFSPTGRTVATVGNDGLALIWDVELGRVLVRIEGHGRGVNTVAFSPDGGVLLTGSGDGTARLWRVADGVELRNLEGHNAGINGAEFSPDGSTIATAGGDGSARLWNYGPSSNKRELTGHTGLLRYASFSSDDSLLVTAGEDRQPRLWDVASGQELWRLRGHEHSVWSAEFSPDDKRILTASQDGTIRLWDIETRREVMTRTVDIEGVNYAAFSSDGSRIVTVSKDKLVRIWDAEQLTILHELAGHEQEIIDADFSDDGALLATASADHTARLWDVVSGEQVGQFEGHHDWIWFVDFDSTGTRLVTAGGDGTARLWDVESGEELRVFRGHTGLVRSARFSPDDRTIVTAGEDKSARLWDAVTGREQELRQLLGHRAEVWYADFSHDGRTIVTASFDQTVRLWDADVNVTLARAQSLIQRDPPMFTTDERDRYRLDEETGLLTVGD